MGKSHNHQPLIGSQLNHRYQIEALRGEGGVAWVFRGRDLHTHKPVAIKILYPQHAQNDSLRQRFIREARLQAQLQHPNIVRIFDFIEEHGRYGIIQEWIDGDDLQEWLETTELPLAPGQIEYMFLPLIRAVGHAHQHGIIHRDIKPRNILLAPATPFPMPKLADFGLAKSEHVESITDVGKSLGTPLFMSPEQIRDSKHADHRTDIYSLGVLLYYMSSGILPFVGSVFRLYHLITTQDPSPPANTPNALAHIILKCLDKEPANRFQSCEALEAALVEAFRNLKQEGHPPADGGSTLAYTQAAPDVDGMEDYFSEDADANDTEVSPFRGYLQATQTYPKDAMETSALGSSNIPLQPDLPNLAQTHIDAPPTQTAMAFQATEDAQYPATIPRQDKQKSMSWQTLALWVLIGFLGLVGGGIIYFLSQPQ